MYIGGSKFIVVLLEFIVFYRIVNQRNVLESRGAVISHGDGSLLLNDCCGQKCRD